jgi:hypothetical protein
LAADKCPAVYLSRSVLGTASSQQRTSPPARADELAKIVLPDHECHDVRLGGLWADRPAALAFLRHYG